MLFPVMDGEGTALDAVGAMFGAAPPLGERLGVDPTKVGAELDGADGDGTTLLPVGATLVTNPALGTRLDKDPATDGTLLDGFN